MPSDDIFPYTDCNISTLCWKVSALLPELRANLSGCRMSDLPGGATPRVCLRGEGLRERLRPVKSMLSASQERLSHP